MLALRLVRGARPAVQFRRLLVAAASAGTGFLLLCTLGYALGHPDQSAGAALRLAWCLAPIAATVQFAVAVARTDPATRPRAGLAAIGLGPGQLMALTAVSTAVSCTLGSVVALLLFLHLRGGLTGLPLDGAAAGLLAADQPLPLPAVLTLLALVPVIASTAGALVLRARGPRRPVPGGRPGRLTGFGGYGLSAERIGSGTYGRFGARPDPGAGTRSPQPDHPDRSDRSTWADRAAGVEDRPGAGHTGRDSTGRDSTGRDGTGRGSQGVSGEQASRDTPHAPHAPHAPVDVVDVVDVVALDIPRRAGARADVRTDVRPVGTDSAGVTADPDDVGSTDRAGPPARPAATGVPARHPLDFLDPHHPLAPLPAPDGLPWGAAVLALGIAVETAYAGRTAPAAGGPALPGGFTGGSLGVLVGWVLTAIGLALAGPALTHLSGRLLQAVRPGALRLLAGRVLMEEATRIGRPLGVVCAVASGAYAMTVLPTGPRSDIGPLTALGALLVAGCTVATLLTTAVEARNARAGVTEALLRIGAPAGPLRATAALRAGALLVVLTPLTWAIAQLAALPLTL